MSPRLIPPLEQANIFSVKKFRYSKVSKNPNSQQKKKKKSWILTKEDNFKNVYEVQLNLNGGNKKQNYLLASYNYL